MLRYKNKRSSWTTRALFGSLMGVLLPLATGLVFARAATAADINVGPGRSVATLAAGVAAAHAGDRVLLDPGIYVDDTAKITVPLTIEGAGTGATLLITQPIANHKGILVIDATTTVRNLTFQGAAVTVADGNNGAGIRMEQGNLTVDTCAFVGNQDGMLVNPNPAATVTVTNSRFVGNGAGDGYSHAIYVNEVGQFTVNNSSFAGTKVGHNIKSRALRTTVTNSIIDDGVTGSSSYAIDLPNGGVVLIDSVQITQGVNTQNPTMIEYGAEGNLKPANSLTISNSTFINQLQSPSAVGLYNWTSTVPTLSGNTFQGLPTTTKGASNTPASVGVLLRQASVFSSAQTFAQSHLRFFNTGSTAGTVKVTLYDGVTGQSLAQWQSPSIAPNAAPQVSIATIESAATQAFAKPTYYAVGIEPTFSGSFQHVLYRPADGTLTNLTMCDTGVTNNGAKLANVHTSQLSGGWPSAIVIYNTSASATAVTLGIYDARDGSPLGSFTTAPVAAGGQSVISVDSIEAGARITPSAAQMHYTLRVESPFTGVLQHLVNNQRVGAVTDMTAVCGM